MPALIAYVEDNAFVREAVAELLAGPGREVHSFDNADDADAWMLGQPVELLVTDVNLPGTSGLELARRALRRHPSQAVVLCSGHALQAGVAALGPRVRAVLKPFDEDEFVAIVGELLAAAPHA